MSEFLLAESRDPCAVCGMYVRGGPELGQVHQICIYTMRRERMEGRVEERSKILRDI